MEIESISDKEARLRAIARLRAVAQCLIARFGGNTSLGELNAALMGHSSLLLGEEITVTGLHEASGLPTSTISSIIKRKEHLNQVPNPDDDRSKLIKMDDLDGNTKYCLEAEQVWKDTGQPDPS